MDFLSRLLTADTGFTRLSFSLCFCVYVRPLYHSKLYDWEASCLCRGTWLGVLAIFTVTSLCFAKEHRADKGRGVMCVCLTVGKARAQELEQERQRRWLENRDVCLWPIWVLKAGNDCDMFGLQLLISTIFQLDHTDAKYSVWYCLMWYSLLWAASTNVTTSWGKVSCFLWRKINANLLWCYGMETHLITNHFSLPCIPRGHGGYRGPSQKWAVRPLLIPQYLSNTLCHIYTFLEYYLPSDLVWCHFDWFHIYLGICSIQAQTWNDEGLKVRYRHSEALSR